MRSTTSTPPDVPDWPVPEYPVNVTSKVGNPGLTPAEAEEIVALLKMLTDSKLAQVK